METEQRYVVITRLRTETMCLWDDRIVDPQSAGSIRERDLSEVTWHPRIKSVPYLSSRFLVQTPDTQTADNGECTVSVKVNVYILTD